MGAERAKIYSISQGEFVENFRNHLRLAFSNSKAPVKEIAKRASVPLPTAKNWWEGRSMPQALHWERLKHSVPELDIAIQKLHETSLLVSDVPELRPLMRQLMNLDLRNPEAVKLLDSIRRYAEAKAPQ